MFNFVFRLSNGIGRFLDKAFEYLSTASVEMDRPSVPNVAVVITDRPSSLSSSE